MTLNTITLQSFAPDPATIVLFLFAVGGWLVTWGRTQSRVDKHDAEIKDLRTHFDARISEVKADLGNRINDVGEDVRDVRDILLRNPGFERRSRPRE